MKDNQNRYAFADSLRGLAALWVVLYHLFHGDHINKLSDFIGKTLSTIFFESGNLGVPIFFVLSGFVMSVTTNNKHIGWVQFQKFVLRRVVRISPPYYFSIVITLILLAIKIFYVDHSGDFPNISTIVAHLFYSQGFLGYKQINVVYWTLCYEIQFYIVFGLIVYLASKYQNDSTPQLAILVSATLISIFWLVWSSNSPSSPIYQYSESHLLFINYWYSFCAGALVGWSITKDVNFEKYLIGFYISIILIGSYYDNWFAIASGLTAFFLHLALIKNKMSSWLNFRFLQVLGLISYSLYLIHNSITGVSARIIRNFFAVGVLTDILIVGFTIVCCIALSYLMYMIIEKPVIKISQKIKY